MKTHKRINFTATNVQVFLTTFLHYIKQYCIRTGVYREFDYTINVHDIPYGEVEIGWTQVRDGTVIIFIVRDTRLQVVHRDQVKLTFVEGVRENDLMPVALGNAAAILYDVNDGVRGRNMQIEFTVRSAPAQGRTHRHLKLLSGQNTGTIAYLFKELFHFDYDRLILRPESVERASERLRNDNDLVQIKYMTPYVLEMDTYAAALRHYGLTGESYRIDGARIYRSYLIHECSHPKTRGHQMASVYFGNAGMTLREVGEQFKVSASRAGVLIRQEVDRRIASLAFLFESGLNDHQNAVEKFARILARARREADERNDIQYHDRMAINHMAYMKECFSAIGH